MVLRSLRFMRLRAPYSTTRAVVKGFPTIFTHLGASFKTFVAYLVNAPASHILDTVCNHCNLKT
ncbi:hypothetical protein ARMA_2022 [Ardenticatena maritima]|uniref:Uncharacterized protein n=1 Tax=Ardenticatena maritima TaxID=872965 RepID=A0A0M8KA64_9CHLR|nr:hypothetical protein ARMA_2022 [Ardenticatena maritima]